jgi:hypothetical protein
MLRWVPFTASHVGRQELIVQIISSLRLPSLSKVDSKEVVEALGPDLVLYFLIHYADPRGRNLRNDLAHGLIRHRSITSTSVEWLIHTLLVLGVWDQLAKQRSKKAAELPSRDEGAPEEKS